MHEHLINWTNKYLTIRAIWKKFLMMFDTHQWKQVLAIAALQFDRQIAVRCYPSVSTAVWLQQRVFDPGFALPH